MDTDCEKILNNEKVVAIFKENDVSKHLQLANCMKEKYFIYFQTFVPSSNSILLGDILKECAADAWNESLRKLIEEIREERFDASLSSFNTFFKTIFKHTYLNLIIAETKKQAPKKGFITPENEKVVPFKDEISYKTYSILKKIGQQCFDYFSWKYLEGFSLENIAAATGKTVKTIKTEMYRCRKDFKILYGKYPK